MKIIFGILAVISYMFTLARLAYLGNSIKREEVSDLEAFQEFVWVAVGISLVIVCVYMTVDL